MTLHARPVAASSTIRGLLVLACVSLCSVQAASAAQQPLICIVIRTYWSHGTYGDSSLINQLISLQKQSHTNWQALLLTLDNRPFPDLHHIVLDRQDERIHVFAEWISARFAPRRSDGKTWSHGYHTRLYNMTDTAIRECPRNTDWIVVSNGDNDFDPEFLATVVKEGAGADAVAFDYYSRFQRPTGMPCERFAAGEGLPPCKENGMSWCQTDLAANVYSWRRWVQEDLRYAPMDTSLGVSHDGHMADHVRSKGWKVHHVRHRCLVEHAPTPQKCAAMGLVWDDSDPGSWTSAGGHCLGPAAAKQLLSQRAMEVVAINVSHDGSSFQLAAPGAPLTLSCIRRSDPTTWLSLRKFFPEACDSSVERQQRAAEQQQALHQTRLQQKQQQQQQQRAWPLAQQ